MADDVAAGLAPPRALLSPFLLLMLAECPGHGYELAERLKAVGFHWNTPAPVYRELRALEAAGLVTSDWVPTSSGPVPRVYEITAAGCHVLQCFAADMVELQGVIAEYLARFRDVAAARSSAGPPAPSPPRPSARRRGRASSADLR